MVDVLDEISATLFRNCVYAHPVFVPMDKNKEEGFSCVPSSVKNIVFTLLCCGPPQVFTDEILCRRSGEPFFFDENVYSNMMLVPILNRRLLTAGEIMKFCVVFRLISRVVMVVRLYGRGCIEDSKNLKYPFPHFKAA